MSVGKREFCNDSILRESPAHTSVLSSTNISIHIYIYSHAYTHIHIFTYMHENCTCTRNSMIKCISYQFPRIDSKLQCVAVCCSVLQCVARGVIVVSTVFGGGEVCIAYTSVLVILWNPKLVLGYLHEYCSVD